MTTPFTIFTDGAGNPMSIDLDAAPTGAAQVRHAAQSITANGQTIATRGNTSAKLSTTLGAAMTGLVMQAGTAAGTEFVLLNGAAYAATFAATGSNVQGGSGVSLAAGAARKFLFDGAAWWPC